uniref:P-type domain-containing protein n=1 Tax=Romanomermis culicivorax TaxID=13658 RepID=A0A915KRE6_ROMCU
MILCSLWSYANSFVDNSVAAEWPKIDCHPEPGATRERCMRRGCSWDNSFPGSPYCYRNNGNSRYKLLIRNQDFVKVDCHPEPMATQERCTDRGTLTTDERADESDG